jgi:alpha-D-xyloside xylohydrolase
MHREIRRPRPLGTIVLLSYASVQICCGQMGTSAPPPLAATTVDLGGGVVASLGSDGSFSIKSGDATLVATAGGVPLLSRTSDPDNPDGWHDPTVPHDDLTSPPIDPTAATLAAVSDGSSTRALHLVVPQQPDDTALMSVSLAADTGFYTGLGEQFGHVSASGRVSPMFLTVGSPWESDTNEAHVPVPFLVSSNGWGLFVASREAGAFDVASSDPAAVKVTFEGRALDVWFFVDPDPLAIVARFARMTGLPRPLPRWALSPIHWRHWASTDDVVSIATQYRQRHIPSSALWLDDGWQTALNTFVISPTIFGDAGAMMSQIAGLGFRVMAWTTPYLEQPHGAPADEAQQLYLQAAAANDFVEDGMGNVYESLDSPIKGGAGIVDFTRPSAQAFWEQLVARATQSGIRGFKCDYAEEMIPNILGQRDVLLFSDGTTSRTDRLYPIEEHATYHAVLDEAFPGDGALIVRASSWGGATQADIIWPGDLDPGFEHQGDPLSSADGGGNAVGGLPAVVIDAQTLAASGFPAFGSDTAGYRHTPTRESTLRWMEHTALTVVMQVYEDGDRLPWLYDDAAGAEYQAMATLHQQLEPYNAILMRQAQWTGSPSIRALPLAFPMDTATFAVADAEYLLGPDLLVAPVTTPGATSQSVHLPPGRWVHWWSDTGYDGPADITVDAPLGSPPLFARAGGLVPMLPAGIDTLVDATAPGVVTLASMATEMQARSWARGPSSVVLDDGAAIVVTDDATGITVAWTPGGSAQNLTIDVDVRERMGTGGAVGTVATLSGAPLAQAAGQAAVAASAASAWALDSTAGHAWLRFVGHGSASIH